MSVSWINFPMILAPVAEIGPSSFQGPLGKQLQEDPGGSEHEKVCLLHQGEK